jgi:hypothetical protein
MRKTNQSGILVLGLFFVLGLFSYMQGAQTKADNGKIIGTWKVEINAGQEFYYLTLEISVTDGELDGTVSESQGTFTDLPVSNILFDGESLSFEFTCATPPDGLERLVKAEFKVGVDALDGTMSVPDLQAAAPATGTREKK